MRVSLTPALEAFVKEKVDAGLYDNASEVVREALRLLREHDDLVRLKLERLREALAKGETDLASGRCVTLSNDDELNDFFARQ
jgi:antitoxin ParD1/3/4